MRKYFILLSVILLSCSNTQEYRNVALMKAASHSSAIDLNQTAQLVTDGLPAENPDGFVSVWKSAGAADEWIQVDLGACCAVDKAVFQWLNPPVSGKLFASNDGLHWETLADIAGEPEIGLKKTWARYFKATLDSTGNGEPFQLAEWELWGKGPAQKASAPDGEISWKLCRDDSRSPWIDAKVPGTVLGSYIAAGALHHPNFADNQLFISDSYFKSDFLYRGTFRARTDSPRQFLNFDGVNFQADIYLNGQPVGFIGSAFDACTFDVTGILKDGDNILDVKIIHNPHYGDAKVQTAYTPGPNGGILGADNPTMHATIGWDWLPTVRGRNMGIYDKVYLTYKGDVSVEEPFVRSELPLPDTTRAMVFASARITNRGEKQVSGVLRGRFGDIDFSREETLAPGESRIVSFDPLTIENPRLWWPNGYGKQELYPVEFVFAVGDDISDSVSFQTGIRQMDCYVEPYKPVSGSPFAGRDNNQRLSMFVNGRRFIGFGGNWGYSEHLLEYGPREYDIAVGNHADMNFTMIRNWVGMTDNKAFYDACDRYGIMIWQDFWLANPYDGPDPENPARFNEVATRYVRRIRNHPSIALYVGRNEGYPPEEIDRHLSQMVPREHPGMFYIPHSAADGVNGGGPYQARPVKEYFNMYGHDKMHSERGMPAVMNYENMVRAMGEENIEPVSTLAHPNPMYGLHDYTLGRLANSAQTTESFNELLEKAFGEPADAREFAYLAQWINYDGYRAMFESRSEYRRGLLLWMSHPAWPSMVWQTYDYYFEPTGAYFGCKKACEPLHIQMNPLKGTVEVVNYHAGEVAGLTAKAQVLNMDGTEAWCKECPLNIDEDYTVSCFPLEVPDDITDAYFVKLALADSTGRCLSDNFYWQGREEGNVKALRALGKTRLNMKARKQGDGHYSVYIENVGNTPALMIRLKVKDTATGDLVLPVRYSDNYFFLLPGENKTVEVCYESCKGKPVFEAEGLNL